MGNEQSILGHLGFLYGQIVGRAASKKVATLLAEFSKRNSHPAASAASPADRLTESDAFLITYGDQVSEPGKAPLHTLAEFLRAHLADTIGGVHLLPHFPYSSDDGFSVIDYWKVDPNLGTWEDVARIGEQFRLMFDGVINHISSQSDWFRSFLRGEKPYTDYFICEDPKCDLSMVTRPRTSPLLTRVDTAAGKKHVWTTFSDDQIDLNFKNPDVLLKIIELFLFYAEQGAEVIRMDAIAYLWKQPGTTCIHLPQTHRIVKLFRSVFDEVAPGVMLITETNVPHPDNISYFGNGTDEAQMVYNFALPPLVLHTFLAGNSRRLSDWAAALTTASPATTFFNFIASHDGIGVMPARGLLNDAELKNLVDAVQAHCGKVSFKSNPDGSESPYELNVTLYDALNDPGNRDDERDISRFLASQVIMLSLAGVPGIYVHSLFGSRNCHTCVEKTGRARSINREKFQRSTLEAELADPHTLKHRIFTCMKRLLQIRRSQPDFHPNAAQRVLTVGDGVFALARGDRLFTVVNVTPQTQDVVLNVSDAGMWRDLIGGREFSTDDGKLSMRAEPYQSLWLKSD
jgi:glucosylglycerate phosphorylase